MWQTLLCGPKVVWVKTHLRVTRRDRNTKKCCVGCGVRLCLSSQDVRSFDVRVPSRMLVQRLSSRMFNLFRVIDQGLVI